MEDFQNLSYGSSGKVVVRLQTYLNEILHLKPPLTASGDFDQATGRAVIQFQRKRHLPVHHVPVVGYDTWKAIGSAIGQPRVTADPDLPKPLKAVMAPDDLSWRDPPPMPDPGCYGINWTLGCDPVKWYGPLMRRALASVGAIVIDKTSFLLMYQLKFKTSLDDASSANLTRLLEFMEKDGAVKDLRWYAYMLATVRIECGKDFLPRGEGGCDETGCTPITQVIRGVSRTNNRTYGRPVACGTPAQPCPAGKTSHTYWGRGYVQITGRDNYAKMSKRLGMGDTLLHAPERVMEPEMAYQIMSVGMREGLFTGKKLSDFINWKKLNYFDARNIINPADTSTFPVAERFAKGFQEILEGCLSR